MKRFTTKSIADKSDLVNEHALDGWLVGWLVGWLESNVPFQRKCDYIRDENTLSNRKIIPQCIY